MSDGLEGMGPVPQDSDANTGLAVSNLSYMDWAALLQATLLIAVGALTTTTTTFLTNRSAQKKVRETWAREDRLNAEQRDRDELTTRYSASVERATQILGLVDEIAGNFDAQRRERQLKPGATYQVRPESVDQIRKHIRLIPEPMLRDIILDGVTALTGLWMPASFGDIDGAPAQRRTLAIMASALTAFLNRERVDSSEATELKDFVIGIEVVAEDYGS